LKKFLIIEEKIELAIIKVEGYKQVLGELDMKLSIKKSRDGSPYDLYLIRST